MTQWTALLQKELIENWRNFKWIWVPLVMVLLASMDPISTYYLPQIIEAVGGLPDGAEISIPDYKPADIIMMTLSQFSSLGVLVIVLTTMGVIASERKSGVLELILVKPVSYKNYILAKWLSILLLIWIAFIFGMIANWYYVNILFGSISITILLKVIVFFGLWLSLVISFSILYNSMFKTPGLVAFFTILSVMLMSIVTKIFAKYLEWSPSNISDHIHQMLVSGDTPTALFGSLGITIIMIAVLLLGSVVTFKSKEMAN